MNLYFFVIQRKEKNRQIMNGREREREKIYESKCLLHFSNKKLPLITSLHVVFLFTPETKRGALPMYIIISTS